jgi:hypothetical protein
MNQIGSHLLGQIFQYGPLDSWNNCFDGHPQYMYAITRLGAFCFIDRYANPLKAEVIFFINNTGGATRETAPLAARKWAHRTVDNGGITRGKPRII